MIDANARSGPNDQSHVFDNDDISNVNTGLFREFLAEHDLCAPATLTLHEGENTTWLHPKEDSEYRIEYVLVPMQWREHCSKSCSLDHLDFGHLGDHRAMAVEFQWNGSSSSTPATSSRTRYARTKISTTDLENQLEEYQPLQWKTDIETQVEHFNAFIHTTLQRQCPIDRQGPKKSFITPHIWQLRARKLRLQRQCKLNKKKQRSELLARIFLAWTGRCDHAHLTAALQFETSLRTSGLKTRADLHQTAIKLRKELTTAKRAQVQDAIKSLPQDSAASCILNTLKPIIGPTNPKLRKTSPLPMILNEQGKPCTTPAELSDCWANFFGAMEGGERVSDHDLRQDWLRSLDDFMQTQIALTPEDIPSLTDLEAAYRRVRPHKAVGDDSIPPELCHQHPVQMARMTFTQLMKLCTHGQETLQHKGGLLIAAWKRKGPQNVCSSYRSLLISSHVGKTVHRAVRDHQADVYESFLQHQQVGGRRHFPVTIGVHYIRAAARKAQQFKQSHALIFLDLQEAFYRVLRPIALGGQLTDSMLATVAGRLKLPVDAVRDLQYILQLPAATEIAGLPLHLRRALQALHTNTHFRVRGQADTTQTRIGSRPGDPFADVVFGYMFSRLLSMVEQRMQEHEILETIYDSATPGLFPASTSQQPVPFPILGPTWMDDLCITTSAATAHGVEQKASLTASILLEVCMTHGVTPNLQKGKTEILFTFRGQGARTLKQKYFSPQQGHRMTVVTEYGTHDISVVGDYVHFGSLTHHSGHSRKEMRRRIAIGNSAFNAHRRLLFQNQDLSPTKRAELFMTLVNSKISYGTETWVLDDLQSQKYFHGAILRLYKRLLKIAPDQAVQDEEVLNAAQLPAPEELLRLARLRYIGLLYKCEEITPWALLRADSGWMQQVQADLQWLWKLVANTTKLPNPNDHFPSWEYVLRYHRSYWKTLLQRGLHLARLHRQDDLLLRRLHHDVFAHLAQWGPIPHAPIRPHIPVECQLGHYGCMQCELRCRTKAGEGAHLFKVHGIIARERYWITHTACEVCLKEYHSHDKLQAHLRRSTTCREQMVTRPPCTVVQPRYWIQRQCSTESTT